MPYGVNVKLLSLGVKWRNRRLIEQYHGDRTVAGSPLLL